ncbi:MAG: hypothetical protein IPG92_10385 [Flavobacteriales bacterium]|nr:hypothetical protein [Flavobacteriales bacterium]
MQRPTRRTRWFTRTEATDTTSVPLAAGSDTAQIAEYIVAAFEDSNGNLWFGTNGQGVARWDGKALRYFSIAEGLVGDVVTGIAEDRDGNLWFGTHTGASRFNGKTFTELWQRGRTARLGMQSAGGSRRNRLGWHERWCIPFRERALPRLPATRAGDRNTELQDDAGQSVGPLRGQQGEHLGRA